MNFFLILLILSIFRPYPYRYRRHMFYDPHMHHHRYWGHRF